MRIWMSCFAAMVVASQPVSTASAMGDPANGKRLAERWCASCHLVSKEQATTTTEAPPFEGIAQRSPEEIAGLAAFLTDPHPPMPQLNLTRDEIRDLVAYIASLKRSD